MFFCCIVHVAHVGVCGTGGLTWQNIQRAGSIPAGMLWVRCLGVVRFRVALLRLLRFCGFAKHAMRSSAALCIVCSCVSSVMSKVSALLPSEVYASFIDSMSQFARGRPALRCSLRGSIELY